MSKDVELYTKRLDRMRASWSEEDWRDYRETQEMVARAQVAKYQSKLRECAMVLPAFVPDEGWTEESLAEVTRLVRTIRKRLSVWQEESESRTGSKP